jgi:hypothetical protein
MTLMTLWVLALLEKYLLNVQMVKHYYLALFLGGDMQFLLTALGLNAANSKYSCLYCKIDKYCRGDMSKMKISIHQRK